MTFGLRTPGDASRRASVLELAPPVARCDARFEQTDARTDEVAKRGRASCKRHEQALAAPPDLGSLSMFPVEIGCDQLQAFGVVARWQHRRHERDVDGFDEPGHGNVAGQAEWTADVLVVDQRVAGRCPRQTQR